MAGEREKTNLATPGGRMGNHPNARLLESPSARGFPCSSASKESACNVGDLGSIPGMGRSPGEGKGYPLQWNKYNKECCINICKEHRKAQLMQRERGWGKDEKYLAFIKR